MADIIEKAWYQGTDGQAYVASCYYSRDPWWNHPRGYYVSVEPVDVWRDGGFVGTMYGGATADGEVHLVNEVARKSNKASEEAVLKMWYAVNEYFEKRGKVARKCSLDELL